MLTLTALVPVIATVVVIVIGAPQDLKKESIQWNPDDRCPKGNVQRLLPHETDCSLFYICLHGQTVLQKCPHNLHFNALKSVCDFPQNAQCEKETVRPPQGRLGDGIFSIVCPPENGRDHLLVSHPTDCDKYYMCDNGVPQLRDCQPGLHFNPSSRACDYPEAAGCDTSVTKSPRDHVSDGGSQCPSKNGVLPVLMKHSTDCAKFYICDNGKPHLKECQLGLHFNPKVGACDYPANVKCDASDNSKDGLGRRGKLPDEFDNGCPPVDTDETVLVSDPSDCSKYFMCHRGQSHSRSCPFGLHFNRFSQECDYPDKAQCYAMGPMLSVGVPSPFCPVVSGKIPIFYRHPNNCSVYYLCSNGLAYEFVCPARLHFNIRQKVCDYETNAKCPAGGSNL